jgi:hypothetical protein
MEELEILEVLQNEVTPKVDCKENSKQEPQPIVIENTAKPVDVVPVENAKKAEPIPEETKPPVPEVKGKATLSASDFESYSVEELMGLACQTFETLKCKMAKKILPEEKTPEVESTKKEPKEMAKEFINEMEKKSKENEKH